MNELQLGELKTLTDKVAMEIVFAEVGKDNGLLPINCLIGEIEELIAGIPDVPAIAQAVRSARQWVDGLFDGSGVFTAPVLQLFSEWTAWVQNAVLRLEQNSPPESVPESWENPLPPITKPAVIIEAASQTRRSTEEPTLVINIEADGDLLREFINESREHLQNIEQGVLVLEVNPVDEDTLNTIFRAFHTFKGGSGFLQLIAIQSLAHELESLLDQMRQHKLIAGPAVINLILEGRDALSQFVEEIDARLAGQKAGHIIVPTLVLLNRIRAILSGEAPPAAIPEAAPVPANGRGPAPVSTSASSVKVETSKLDSLVDLVGELVISQSLVAQNKTLVAAEDQRLNRDMLQLGRIARDLQRTAMSLRMVPIRASFQKMNRLVRDTAARIEKQVELIMEGEDTELDRTIVEEISDPLIHMIRNAIDHGIELPAERQRRGKSPVGTIRLSAFHKGGNVVIEIKDDGNGLDKARLLAKAVEKGIVPEGSVLADSEIFNLIFAPGFSTAEKVTDLSGRGVGMDVVRRNIEKLRGKVEIQSTSGQGSTFSIYLPLTLAIIDGLIVGVGDHRYILPTLSVCESFRPTVGMIASVQGRGEMIRVRGRLRPVLRLHEHLGIQPTSTDPTQSIAVVVEAGKDARCVIVDQLLGKQEVVIKSLGDAFKQNRALAGAAILGDGRVGLILDPHALVELTSNALAQAAKAAHAN